MKKKVLVIDDERNICLSLKEGLKDLGYGADTALDVKEGIKKIMSFKPHVALVDMRLGEENGLELVKEIKNIDKEIEIIVMTAYGTIETAVQAIKNGAYDYINKPFDLQEIEIAISRAFQNIDMQRKIYLFEKENNLNSKTIISNHSYMDEVFKKISILANNDKVTVLIRGETGTGKELVAEAIHKNSVRKNSPMLKINCAALPPNLIESELFGFEKNAFTGANSRKKGLFEIADGGTIFLDEIGEISLDVQAKLLRFLEERKFKRVGGLTDIEVDVRVIAATNKDLEEAKRKREFREDLYYRLNVVPIFLPPLRERGEDVLLIANHFIDTYNKKFNKNIKGFTREAEKKLLSYGWPGNVRELKNVIERIVILNNSEYIDINQLPAEICSYCQNKERTINGDFLTGLEEKLLRGGFSLDKEIQSMEKKYIRIALEKAKNNYTKASGILGISRFALKRKIEKYFQNEKI